jgi:hypothetical protein
MPTAMPRFIMATMRVAVSATVTSVVSTVISVAVVAQVEMTRCVMAAVVAV